MKNMKEKLSIAVFWYECVLYDQGSQFLWSGVIKQYNQESFDYWIEV